jgi:putative ABC transport system permease protein
MGKDLFAVTPAPLKDALASDIPEVENSTKCKLIAHTLEYNSSLFTEKGFLYADPDFLKIFIFPVISGNPVEELKEPFTLFITKDMDIKYFGNEEAVGKTIKVDNKYLFTVRGILENIPQNSNFDFDFLTGFETYHSMRGGKEKVETWGNFSYSTYVLLFENFTQEDIRDKLMELPAKYLPKEPLFKDMQWIPVPLTSIHLGGNANFDPGINSDIRYLYLIISIGVFIFATVLAVILTCLGQYSLSSYTTKSRTKEMVIRKVMGSQPSEIMLKLTGEMAKLIFVSIVFAWPLSYLMMNRWLQNFAYHIKIGGAVFMFSLFISLVISLIAVSYHVIKLSRVNPAEMIRHE